MPHGAGVGVCEFAVHCYHPIAYTSHGLKGGELKYHSSKLEFLALKWAVTEQLREYLQYQPFLVRTDNTR